MTSKNPFVGPEPLKEGQTLYGRDAETRELCDLLVAERVVWLYSPSGAGKSSLVRAGLLPVLKKKHFDVWPVIRVHEKPAGDGANRYIESAIRSLDTRYEPGGHSFHECVERRLAEAEDDAADVVLIFDQFEEILTLDATDDDAKEAFFDDIGLALKNRNVWALFTLREDYMAGMDPFIRYVPTGRANTFRLTPLSEEAAHDVITQTAGPAFDGDAVDRLVENLTTQKQRHIEPVQLQVVCRRLWRKGNQNGRTITADDVGSDIVDNALSGFYDDEIRDAATTPRAASERDIREWFQKELITHDGFRNAVRREDRTTGSLDNETVRLLENSHLIRAEERSGQFWYELAHDRLVRPVQRSNEAWFRKNLSAFQLRAALWKDRGKQKDGFLRGAELADAEAWVSAHPEALKSHEQEFLDGSREVEERARRERRTASTIRNLLYGVCGLLVVAGYLTFKAYALWQGELEAKRQAEQAWADEREAQDEADELRTENERALREQYETQKRLAEEREQRIEAQEQRLAAELTAREAKEKELEAKRLQDLADQRAAFEREKRQAQQEAAVDTAREMRGKLVTALDDKIQSDVPATSLHALEVLMPYEHQPVIPDVEATKLDPQVRALIERGSMNGWFDRLEPTSPRSGTTEDPRNFVDLALELDRLDRSFASQGANRGRPNYWPDLRSIFTARLHQRVRPNELPRRADLVELVERSTPTGDGGSQSGGETFYMQPHEVTFGEFRRLFPSHDNRGNTHKDYPAVAVTWYEAVAYAAWVGGSLPTVSQWESASEAAGIGGDSAWFADNSDEHLHLVNESEARSGLYDVYGNAWEWCLDAELGVETTPARRELRGGSYFNSRESIAEDAGSRLLPDARQPIVGFRVSWTPRQRAQLR